MSTPDPLCGFKYIAHDAPDAVVKVQSAFLDTATTLIDTLPDDGQREVALELLYLTRTKAIWAAKNAAKRDMALQEVRP